MKVPAELLYTSEHEWALVDGDVVTIGVTDYAQSELGDIAYVNLPAVEKQVSVKEKLGEIEAVKTVSEFNAPVSGEIIEVNTLLDANPQYVNSEPYERGWMVKMKMSNRDELQDLLSPKTYQAILND